MPVIPVKSVRIEYQDGTVEVFTDVQMTRFNSWRKNKLENSYSQIIINHTGPLIRNVDQEKLTPPSKPIDALPEN